MSKLVFLTHSFFPETTPRAIQVGRLVEHLGRDVHVYYAGHSGAPKAAYGGHAHFHPVPVAWWENHLSRILRKIAPSLLHRPDGYRWWARRAAREIIKNGIGSDDIVVTFSQPHSDHIAGVKIKKSSGAKWIACFSDPFVDNPFFAEGKNSDNLALEQQIVEQADLLIFTSQETIDLVMAKYPLSFRDKCRVLEHSCAEDEAEESRPANEGTFVIRHLGNMYGRRSPVPLLEALRLLDVDFVKGIRIEFIGRLGQPEALKLAENLPEGLVTFMEPVSYDRSLELMREVHALLLVEAPMDYSPFLPSKLVEYAGTGRPVLALTPPGTGMRVTQEIGGRAADIRDPGAIAAMLAAAVEDFRAGALERAGAQGRERFRPARIAGIMNGYIDELAQIRK